MYNSSTHDECEQEEFGHAEPHSDLHKAATFEEAEETNQRDLLQELVDLPEAVLRCVIMIMPFERP